MILDAVIGWESNIGCWSRVEGTLPKINPNMPHARVESDRLFDDKGRFIPQCSVLGRGVKGILVSHWLSNPICEIVIKSNKKP